MSLPKVVSREEWRRARQELLAKEKAATRARDALNRERRGLPMVEIDKEYVFEGGNGKATLLDLFEGRDQLVVHHFMFAPEWENGCPGCSYFLDQLGHPAHLHARRTSLAAVSRAPYTRLLPFKARMGWTVPWYSSHDSDFNTDFEVTRERDGELFEQPGLSCFLRDRDQVFHTYSTYDRGLDGLGSATGFLDLTALGRQEEWEAPEGRAEAFGPLAGSAHLKYHDEYVD
ncbi:DUF899 domain-containing protein [Streptomyces sp. NPDC059477]|uniref:DUF899 domain-containing protein n=1 Tax=Streptomyces sp. NPDC059477 TaxID=3346847 RepID=UPI0036B044F4